MQVTFFLLEQSADWETAYPSAASLRSTGLLNGIRHSCIDPAVLNQWAGDRHASEPAYFHRQAVRDGKPVTDNGAAALKFVRKFLLAPEQDVLNWYLFHKLGVHTALLAGM